MKTIDCFLISCQKYMLLLFGMLTFSLIHYVLLFLGTENSPFVLWKSWKLKKNEEYDVSVSIYSKIIIICRETFFPPEYKL